MPDTATQTPYTRQALLYLGATLRVRRKALGLTQREVATKAGISKSALGALEQGERSLRLEKVLEVAQALDLPMWSLFPPEPQGPLAQVIQGLLGHVPRMTEHILGILTLQPHASAPGPSCVPPPRAHA